MSLAQYSKEQLQEMSMLELAYLILSGKSERSAVPFKAILDEIIAILDLSEEEVRVKVAQFYTDLNIDGRFISVGENQWGLRNWYPYDQIDEEVVPVAKPKKKKKAKKVVDEELEDFDELEDEDLEYEDLDSLEDDDSDDVDEELEDEDFDNLDEDEFDDDVVDDDDYDLDDEEIEDDEDYEDKDEEDEDL